MSDNTVINAGSGGDTIGTEDVGAYKIPYSKIRVGALDVDGGDVTLANPLPVALSNGITALAQMVNGVATIPVVDNTTRLLLEQLLLTLQDVLAAIPAPITGTGFAHYTNGNRDAASSTSCAFLDGAFSGFISVNNSTTGVLSTTGLVRFPNVTNTVLAFRNAANAADIRIIRTNFSSPDYVEISDTNATATLIYGNVVQIKSGNTATVAGTFVALCDAAGNPGVTYQTVNNGACNAKVQAGATSWVWSQNDNTTNSATAAPSTFRAANATGTSATGGSFTAGGGTGTLTYGAFIVQGHLNVGARYTQAMADANQASTAAQGAANIIFATGALTGTRTLTLACPPTDGNVKEFRNNCTGGSVTISFSSGTGLTVAAGTAIRFCGDGTNAVLLGTMT